MNHVFLGSLYILGLMWGSGLANQADLSSEASGPGVLQQARYCVVVQVVDEIPNPCLMGCSQFIRCQRGQRGASIPRTLTITGGAQRQLGLEREEGVQKEM